jgi:hypothetical protein
MLTTHLGVRSEGMQRQPNNFRHYLTIEVSGARPRDPQHLNTQPIKPRPTTGD